jgi:predicted nucleotidyltransferase
MANARRLAYIEIMRRDDVIARLKETEPVLRGFGVAALRDEASPDSDVDVFIDVAPDATFGLRPYMGAFRVLEDAFEHKVAWKSASVRLHPKLENLIAGFAELERVDLRARGFRQIHPQPILAKRSSTARCKFRICLRPLLARRLIDCVSTLS